MKEMWKFVRVCLPVIVCTLFLGVGMKAEAAVTEQVKGLKQADAGSSTVEVEWKAVTGDDIAYRVELCSNNRFVSGVKTEHAYSSPNQSFFSLSSGTKYYVRVCAYNEADPNEHGPWSKTLEVVTEPAQNKDCKLRQTGAKETSITLKWKKNPQANAYRIEYFKSGNSGSKKTIKLGNVATYTIKKLDKDADYSFYLYSVKKTKTFEAVNTWHDDALYGCPTLPGKVNGLEGHLYSPTSNYLDLSWNKRAGADGYQCEVWTVNGKGSRLLTYKNNYNSGSMSFQNNKLKKAQFLKIRLRAYVDISGGTKYGKWSGWVYTSRQPALEIQNGKGCQKLSWPKVNGADSYTIQMSTEKNTGYKTIATTSKNSLTVTKCGKSALKEGKTYYYTVVANKKIDKKMRHGSKTHYVYRTYYNYNY